jgi:succinoglycan biosynthesis transport protein ExoP
MAMHDQSSEGLPPNPAGGRQLAPVRSAELPVSARDSQGVLYPAEPHEGGEELAATIRKYLRIFIKRKWLLLGITIFSVSMGALSAFMKTPLYTSTIRIQIDQQATKVLENGATTPIEQGGAEFQRTQLELLKSRAMAERVVSALQLEDETDFFKPRDVSLTGIIRGLFSPTTPPENWPLSARKAAAAGLVSGYISVRPVAGSRLVDLTFTDPSPARAQRIANAYADAYVASTVDKRFEANSYAKTFLDDQVKQIKLRLEESERAMLEFAEKEKIVESNEKSSIAESNLAAANASLGMLISDRIKNEQLWRQAEAAPGITLPQLLTNSVIDGLRGRQNELRRDYQEKLQTFKPSYPAMVEIANQLREVDRQLSAEVQTIRASLKAAYESSRNQENDMRQRIDELRNDVLELQKKGIRHNILKREVETNRGLYNSLLQRFKEVDIASGVGTNTVFIVDRAQIPGSPSEPRIGRVLMLALMLGFGAGMGAAYLLELFDDRIRVPEDVEQISSLSTLGIIPLLRSEETFVDELADPGSSVSEAYRSLATALQFSTESGLPRSLVVTSAGPSEGKSSTALAIARHFATLGMKVLLVDADLRKPSLHEKLHLPNGFGLSNHLTGSATPPEILQKTDYDNLAFIASGPLPPNAGDLLGGTRIFSLLKIGSEVFDLIVIDSPPLLGIADAQLLASAAAATVFVVGAGQSRKAAIQGALRRLQLARVTPIGLVLTKFDIKAAGYGYGYGYAYAYGAGYGYGPAIRSESQPQNAPAQQQQIIARQRMASAAE